MIIFSNVFLDVNVWSVGDELVLLFNVNLVVFFFCIVIYVVVFVVIDLILYGIVVDIYYFIVFW